MRVARPTASLVSSLLVGTFVALFLILMSACGGGNKAGNNASASGTPGNGASGSGPTSSGASPGGTSSSGGSSGGASAGSGSTGSGGTSGGTTSGGGSTTTAALAYVAGSNNDLYGIRVDSASTVTQTAGSPYALPGRLFGLAAANGLVFASTGNVAAHSINILSYRADSNGTLTLVATTTEANDDFGGLQLALDSSVRFLYLTGGNAGQQLVYGFSIDTSSGKLTPLTGSPWSVRNAMGVSMPVVTPNGSRLCVDGYAGRTNDVAICYARHGDGTIDPNSYTNSIASSTGFSGLAISRDSNYILGTNSRDSIDIGQLSSKSSSSVPSGGQAPLGIAMNPSSNFVAVANEESNNVVVFALDAAGRLTQSGSPVTAGSDPDEVAFSASGSYLFVGTQAGTLVFSFNSNTGTLNPLNASNPAPGSVGPLAAM